MVLVAVKFYYMAGNTHDRRAAVGGGGGCGAHLGRDEARVDAGAGQRAVHLVVAHHGEGAGVGAGDGQGRTQGRGGCREEEER